MKFLFESLKERDVLLYCHSKGNGFDFQFVNEFGIMLFCAVKSGNLELVQYVIEKGNDFNIIFHMSLDGADLLKKCENFKYPVDKGADVNAKDKNGEIVLHMAARSGNSEI